MQPKTLSIRSGGRLVELHLVQPGERSSSGLELRVGRAERADSGRCHRDPPTASAGLLVDCGDLAVLPVDDQDLTWTAPFHPQCGRGRATSASCGHATSAMRFGRVSTVWRCSRYVSCAFTVAMRWTCSPASTSYAQAALVQAFANVGPAATTMSRCVVP